MIGDKNMAKEIEAQGGERITNNPKYWVKERGGEHGIKFCREIASAIKEAKKHNFAEIWKYEETIKAYRKYREYSHGEMIWRAAE